MISIAKSWDGKFVMHEKLLITLTQTLIPSSLIQIHVTLNQMHFKIKSSFIAWTLHINFHLIVKGEDNDKCISTTKFENS
jgi:exopolysaccharide biosynthesis predicted pyruvyltransferase EpsI